MSRHVGMCGYKHRYWISENYCKTDTLHGFYKKHIVPFGVQKLFCTISDIKIKAKQYGVSYFKNCQTPTLTKRNPTEAESWHRHSLDQCD